MTAVGVAAEQTGLAAALDAASIIADTGRRARYEIGLHVDGCQEALAAALRKELRDEPFRIEGIIADDPTLLLLTFTSRRFAADTGAMFELAYRLGDLTIVDGAQPDVPTDLFPDDPEGRGADEGRLGGYPSCWAGSDPTLSDPFWALDAIRARSAWAHSTARERPCKGSGVVVAQPDTGVVVHAELDVARRVPAFDFLDGDDDPEDPLGYSGSAGHGTATASVVLGSEGGRMAGVAPAALHMPLRCIDSVIRISQVEVARAIDFAIENGADVVTMSLGGLPSISLARAIGKAVARNVIVLAAAGNCAKAVAWPARYDDCIAVAGTTKDDETWRGSCSGYAIDWSAPAENVFVARPDGEDPRQTSRTVSQGEGTSYAVGLSAGVAALWIAHHGKDRLLAVANRRGETLQHMFRRLVGATARRPGQWDAANYGAGVIDAEALLMADLELGTDRERENQGIGPRDRAVQTLAVELLGASARDSQLDHERFGPEIANLLLSPTRPSPVGSLGAEGRSTASMPSRRLVSAVGNDLLRARLGNAT